MARRWCAGLCASLLAGSCAPPANAPPTRAGGQSNPGVSEVATPAVDPVDAETRSCSQPASFQLDRRRVSSPEAPGHLMRAVADSPYQYFRLFASEFSRRVCDTFAGVRRRLPIARVHGDAHVLQFVVTQDSFGLEDFDRAGLGPTVVDLVRYAVSLRLVCHEVAFGCDADQMVDLFLSTAKRSLELPLQPLQAPSIVARLRRDVPDGVAWLGWAESLMGPLTNPERAGVDEATSAFVEQQLKLRPERPASFYEVVKAGRLKMGVGSALERKLLFRIQGPSTAPEDDLILEARSVTPHSPCDCVWWPEQGLSFQALLFMSVFGRRMPAVFGHGKYDVGEGPSDYWVQAWDPGYRELRLLDLESQAQLAELARDAAIQLMSPLWTRYTEPLRAHQRLAQLEAFDLVAPRVPSLVRELTNELLSSWQQFRSQVAASPQLQSQPKL